MRQRALAALYEAIEKGAHARYGTNPKISAGCSCVCPSLEGAFRKTCVSIRVSFATASAME